MLHDSSGELELCTLCRGCDENLISICDQCKNLMHEKCLRQALSYGHTRCALCRKEYTSELIVRNRSKSFRIILVINLFAMILIAISHLVLTVVGVRDIIEIFSADNTFNGHAIGMARWLLIGLGWLLTSALIFSLCVLILVKIGSNYSPQLKDYILDWCVRLAPIIVLFEMISGAGSVQLLHGSPIGFKNRLIGYAYLWYPCAGMLHSSILTTILIILIITFSVKCCRLNCFLSYEKRVFTIGDLRIEVTK
jgi:hypothetical protein